MSEKFITVTSVYAEAQAEILKAVLQSHEIVATVMGNPGLQQGYGLMATFQIVVAAADVARAKDVIAQYNAGNFETDEDLA